MKSYRELEVWQLACRLVVEVYKVTVKFPASEQFGLTSQIRRAAVSIPSNIAEGFTRRTLADNHNFVRIALASGAELETQLYLVGQLKLVSPIMLVEVNGLLERIMKMLNKLGQRLASG